MATESWAACSAVLRCHVVHQRSELVQWQRDGRLCDHRLVLRLRAQDPARVLDQTEVVRLQFWLLEFLPAARCGIDPGPDIQLSVPEREPGDLTPALRRKIEEIIGCPVIVDTDAPRR